MRTRRAECPCCGSRYGSSTPGSNPPPAETLIECEVFNCLLGNAGVGRVLTLSVSGCSGMCTQDPIDGVTNGDAVSCETVCVEDAFGDWKFDEHDVTLQAGCVLGGDELLIWTFTVTPCCGEGSLSLGFCCIDRDDGASYISVSAYLHLADGGAGSDYVFKTRDFSISTDGTYTYISFSGLAPYQSSSGTAPCCTNPTLSMNLKLTVDGALCL
jgi:hypothetical protein